jgi:ketosteroid isomerase-like protein
LALQSASAAPLPLGERLAATPRLCCEALARTLSEADLEAALACFAPGACLVGPDGTVAHGEGAIRTRLAQLIASGTKVEIELAGVIVAAEVALAHERWRTSCGEGVDASPAPPAGSTLVLRLLGDEWKIAIAAPWGLPASAPLRAIWP